MVTFENTQPTICFRMTKQELYQVDAFTSSLFAGNPAAVCILESWLDDGLMQSIAAENNLSETAFAVKEEEAYSIRWYTPEVEVDLCGHATLATAHVLFEHRGFQGSKIKFQSLQKGMLTVEKANGMLVLDFPADTLKEIPVPEWAGEALHKTPVKAYQGESDVMLVFASQSEVEAMKPDFLLLKESGGRGVIVTSMGREVNFVSRFFAPQTGINEDPVTGSAHTTLVPYWSRVLGKNKLTARQLSKRGGELFCEDMGERVKIAGQAVTYLVGEITIPDEQSS
jgi:PhzF family phenazine biosynthesis protein